MLGLLAHRQGNLDYAVELLERLIVVKPFDATTHNNLGVVLCQMGNFSDGIASYKRAIGIDPGYAVAHSNLGAAYLNDNRSDEAIAQCKQAVTLRENYAEAHFNLGSAYHRQARSKKAIFHFERAIQLNPNYADAKFALCMAELPVVFASQSEVTEQRAAYERRLRVLVNEKQCFADLASSVGTAQSFQLAYQGYNDRELQSLYGSFVCRIMADRYPAVTLTPLAERGERIRIGVVSGYFRQHSNWKIPIKGWISQLDRSRFKVIGYHTGVVRDGETAAAAEICDRFIHGPLSTDNWRQVILSDAPHVLIYPEIGMDPIAANLAAQRLAPVQCNSWGHPETSGFPTLDYYLSSDLMEPVDAKLHYSERLVCLPNLSIYYEPIATTPAAVSRSDFGLRSNATVFWCGQSLFKYLPQFDQIFPRIAREVGACQFVFIHFPDSEHIKELFRQRLELAFSEFGLKYAEYCVIVPKLDSSLFAALLGQADIVLDSIGWSGCNSTFECLQYDLPIVTMPGALMRGRHTMAILSMADVPQTIANTVDEYIEIAVRLAKDSFERAAISSAISRNKHRLYYDRACISALEEFLMRVACSAPE